MRPREPVGPVVSRLLCGDEWSERPGLEETPSTDHPTHELYRQQAEAQEPKEKNRADSNRNSNEHALEEVRDVSTVGAIQIGSW